MAGKHRAENTGKSKEKKRVAVYLDPDTYNAFMEVAEGDNRSLSNQASRIIKEYIEQTKKERLEEEDKNNAPNSEVG